MTATVAGRPALEDPLPADLEAAEPPEARGLARDGVRLMVARGPATISHHRFSDLPELLEPGDVVVVNTSTTLPAEVDAITDAGQPAALHFSTLLPGGSWVVELRHAAPAERHPRPASEAWLDARTGTVLHLPEGGGARLAAPAIAVAPGQDRRTQRTRLWIADLRLPDAVLPYLARNGRPIRYSYVPEEWPIDAYQTVFAERAGSAEMPSAARPFTAELVARLIRRGIAVTPFTLHCGVASPEAHEPPSAEWYDVPEATAAAVNAAKERGNRVVAIGTTAVRALETVGGPTGRVRPGSGWTELVLGPDRPARVADGLVTGWHEPGASHLALLRAVAGPHLIEASYAAAREERYLWHEFGDSHLILP